MKSVDVDNGKYLTIGSLNQDHCSFYQNNEANVLLSAKPSQDKSMYQVYQQKYNQIYKNLRDESRLVDPNEGHNASTYIENKFWTFALFMIKWTLSQREIREEKRKKREAEQK